MCNAIYISYSTFWNFEKLDILIPMDYYTTVMAHILSIFTSSNKKCSLLSMSVDQFSILSFEGYYIASPSKWCKSTRMKSNRLDILSFE